MEKTYIDGLNDAWELANKLVQNKMNILGDELGKIFDGHMFLEDIFDNFTPQEALSKLKAYEEAQIEVGDVVKLDGTCYTYVVTVIQEESDGTYYCGLSKNGKWFAQNNVTKTGKHLDIKSILESIGE